MDIQEIMGLVQELKTSGNAEALLMRKAQENPIIARALQMAQGKSLDQQIAVAQNLAKTNGQEAGFSQLMGMLKGI